MAQTIKIKRSATSGNKLTGSNSIAGEIGMNTADKSLYIQTGSTDSSVVTIYDDSILHLDDTNNRVGIGTTSPSKPLHVVGDALVGGTLAADYITGIQQTGSFLDFDDDTTYGSNGVTLSSLGGLHLKFDTNDNDTNIFGIYANGGSIPVFKLTDAGAATFNNAFTFPTAIGSAGQVLKVPTSGTTLYWATEAAASAGTSLSDADGDTKIQVEETTDEDRIRFDTAGTQRMVVDSTGLTIGSATDTTTLVFPDKTGIPDSPTEINDKVQLIKMGQGGNGGMWQTTGRGGMLISSADDSLVLANGDVGRFYDPNAGGHHPGVANETLALLSDFDIRFTTGLQDGWSGGSTYSPKTSIITAEGRFGIGTTSPGEKLEVIGNVEAEEFIGDIRGATLFKASAGETLAKGDVVYISGISGNTTVVSKADADDANKMPAFGIAAAAASANNPVDVYTSGILSGIDTSSFSEGDELFVSTTAGVLTATPPTGESAALQKIGKVTRSASSGSIFIIGAGRSNATPNLNEGKLFVGNSSNQAVADNTIHVDIANSRVGIGTTSPGRKFTVQGASGDNLPVRIIGGSGTSHGSMEFQDPNTTADYKVTVGSKGDDFYIQAGGGEKVRVKSDGNVGIGTSSPEAKLHTVGHSRLDGAVLQKSGSGITSGNISTNNEYISHNGPVLTNGSTANINQYGYFRGYQAVYGTDGTNGFNPYAQGSYSNPVFEFVSNNRGSISLPTDSAIRGGYLYQFVLGNSGNGGTNSGVELTNSNTTLLWGITSSNHAYFANRVGIGTTSPGTTLDVAGDITSSGVVNAGTHLNVNSSGNLLKVDISAWDSNGNNDQAILWNGYNSTIGDHIVLKAAGNSTAHGAIVVADNVFSYGSTTSAISTSASLTNPLSNSTAFTVTSGGNAAFAGTLSSGAITMTNGSLTLTDGYNLQWGGAYGSGNPSISASSNFLAFYPTGNTDGEVIRIDADGIDMNSHNLTEVGNITTTGTLYGPATFTIDPSVHGDNSGTVVIAGNLQVDGTTTTINSTTLTVDDLNITLASGSTNAAAANGAGITVDCGSDTDATLTYLSSGDQWKFNKELLVQDSNFPQLRLADADDSMEIGYSGENFFFKRNDNDGAIIFRRTDNSDVMAVNMSTMRVGIGTASPTYGLEVLNDQTSQSATGTMYVQASLNGSGRGLVIDSNTRTTADNSVAALQTITRANTTGLKVQVDGNVGIGTSSPTTELEVIGDIKIKQGSGYANYSLIDASEALLTLETYSNNTSTHPADIIFKPAGTERMRIADDGNVGIGTTSPQSELHVNGQVTVSLSDGAYTNEYFARLKSGYNENPLVLESRAGDVIRASNYGQNLTFLTGSNATGTSERMTIDSTGKVGIGTTSPSQKLQVAGTILADTALAASSGDTAIGIGSESTIPDGNSTYKAKLITENNNAKLTTYQYGSYLTLKAGVDGTGYSNNWSKIELRDGGGTGANNAHMKFYTHGDERMVIDNYGNVGIGTNNPVDNYAAGITPESTKLAVVGANVSGYTEVAHFAAGTDSDNTGATVRIGHVGNDRGMFIKAGRGTSNQAKALLGVRNASNADSNILTLQEGGRVGIGTTSPNYMLDVSATGDGINLGGSGAFLRWNSGDIQIKNEGSYKMGFYTYNSSDAALNRHMVIDTNGKVGIGEASPQAKLQIEEAGIDTTTTSTTATTQVAIDTFAAATFRSARYTIQVTNSTDSTYHLTEILLIHNGTTPQITEYGTIFTGSAEATFDADISSGNVRLLATPASTDSMTFKVVRHCITV